MNNAWDEIRNVLQQAHDIDTAAIIAILEGGCIYRPESHKTTSKIIKMCKSEQKKLLRMYDAAVGRNEAETRP